MNIKMMMHNIIWKTMKTSRFKINNFCSDTIKD